MGSKGEVIIFTDTNMATHITLSVSPDITVANFKRELERTHFTFFPTLGEIKAQGLMVRRKGCFYHLTESLPIKYAFQGLKGMWFLYMEVQPLSELDNRPDLSHPVATKIDNHFSGGCSVTSSFTNTEKNNKHNCNKQKIRDIKPLAEEHEKSSSHRSSLEKKNKNSIQFVENRPVDIDESIASRTSGSFAVVETPKKRSADIVSGSRFFDINGNSSALNSERKCYDDNYSVAQAYSTPQFATRTNPRLLHSPLPTDPSPGNRLRRSAAVGRRVLIAANNLSLSVNKRRPVISFYRFKGSTSASEIPRFSMFEISDNDE